MKVYQAITQISNEGVSWSLFLGRRCSCLVDTRSIHPVVLLRGINVLDGAFVDETIVKSQVEVDPNCFNDV
jgi:ADP-glucose pyrophosphorylase